MADALLVSNIVFGVVLIGLAVWLLYLAFGNRIHQSFALYLVLSGLIVLLNQAGRLDPSLAEYYSGVRGYLLVGLAPALLWFFAAYVWRTHARLLRRVGIALLAVTLVFELAYAADHTILNTRLPTGRVQLGPLGILATLPTFLAGALAIYFATISRGQGPSIQARFHRLLALAFLSSALAGTGIAWRMLVMDGWGALFNGAPQTAGPTVALLVNLLALPAGLFALAMVVASAAAASDEVQGAKWWYAGVGLASFVLPVAARILDPSDRGLGFLFVLGLVRLVFPAVVTYAITRQASGEIDGLRLDQRARTGLRRGSVGAAFVAVFFVIGEGSAELFAQIPALRDVDARWADFVGILGAGLLMFFLHPLQRVGERMSHAALPRARPLTDLSHDERARLYREQAEISWMDGSLSVKDRRILDQLRERLGLTFEEASVLEREAAGLSGQGGPEALGRARVRKGFPAR